MIQCVHTLIKYVFDIGEIASCYLINHRSVYMAEWLALPIIDHRVLGLKHGRDVTKTRLFNSDPLKPHFYTVKLGFIGVSIIFLILLEKHRLWGGGSNEYPQSMF